MHSTIIQITTEKVEKENFLTEDDVCTWECREIDYCSEIDEDERKDRINRLVNEWLPSGMFTLVDDNTIRYNGGAEEWKEQWLKLIQDKASQITTDNVLNSIGPMYQLEKALLNPLDLGTLFYDDSENMTSYADHSAEFMRSVCQLEEGTLLYIGGVLDYHY